MVAALADGDAAELASQMHAHIDGGQHGLRTAWQQATDQVDPIRSRRIVAALEENRA